MSLHIAQFRFVLAPVAALLALSVAGAVPAAAQQPHHTVRIALPDSFPGRAQEPALVLRTGADPLDPVILLNKATLDEGAITAAMAAADLLLRRPISPGQTQVMGIANLKRGRPLSARAHAVAADYLRQLQSRPLTRIGNVGPGRWIEVAAPTR